jgi:ABC-type branched-subunit amino acid transport system substrate-binding protein
MMLAACSGDDDPARPDPSVTADAPVPTDATAPTDVVQTDDTVITDATVDADPAAVQGWAVSTDDCDDPGAANAPITGTVRIGSVMPLTGGLASPFAPVQEGFKAYIDFARENGLFRGYDDVELTIGDDQYDPAKTPAAVQTQIDAGAHLFSGIIGTSNNRQAREMLNEACIPQLNALSGSPEWGEVAEFPWTTGLLVPYTVEAQAYAAQLGALFPDGATVGLFYVNNDFGQAYAHGFAQVAGDFGLDIIAEQTIDPADSNPPSLQMIDLAAAAPDVIMAAPLGAGCLSFYFELAAAQAQNPTWRPAVFITNSCADRLILAAAGPGADGLYTGGNLVDIGNPELQPTPAAQRYIDFMTSIGKSAMVADAADGWTTGEVTVAILNQAAASADGLTQASIMNAARNLEITPSLARPGVVDRTDGENDPFLAQSLQVLQYDVQTSTFVDVGELITDFET